MMQSVLNKARQRESDKFPLLYDLADHEVTDALQDTGTLLSFGNLFQAGAACPI